VVRADGREINMRTQGDVVCDADDQPVRMVGICEDVTDQLRAREAEKHLAAADALRQRAGAINDEIVQRLVLAGAMLERGEVEHGVRASRRDARAGQAHRGRPHPRGRAGPARRPAPEQLGRLSRGDAVAAQPGGGAVAPALRGRSACGSRRSSSSRSSSA
jgi:hypothetical protein